MAQDNQIEIRFNSLLAHMELEKGYRPTQKEVAETIGIAESTLSRFVQGKTGRFDSDILIKLVDYFDGQLENGCTLADLIAYPPAPSQDIVNAALPVVT
ncbi:helix-turn-helix domain-containing protein [Candidatus Saccharibacteria bacterium]|nr:helix-turn-helix domain-containing protein [Candidatus Saccharibacteria bacterium]